MRVGSVLRIVHKQRLRNYANLKLCVATPREGKTLRKSPTCVLA